jgi:hypothetical protein
MSLDPDRRPEELVGRLLGPEGPEVGCDECFDQLDQFVEGELAGADVVARHPGMAAHLEGCPACREDYESLKALLASS